MNRNSVIQSVRKVLKRGEFLDDPHVSQNMGTRVHMETLWVFDSARNEASIEEAVSSNFSKSCSSRSLMVPLPTVSGTTSEWF